MASLPPPPQGPPPAAPPPPPPPGDTPAAGLPWEQPGAGLEGLYETAKLFITRPTEAFARMAPEGDLAKPLIYAVVIGWIGTIVSQVYGLMFQSVMWDYLPGLSGREGLAGRFAMTTGWTIVLMVAAPIFILLGIFIGSAIVHVVLMLVGGANASFTATVRAISYSYTSQLAQVVPFCGGLVSFVWLIVLAITGLAAAHRTSTGKAALAVLLPFALCCVCAALAIAFFGAAIAAAVSSNR